MDILIFCFGFCLFLFIRLYYLLSDFLKIKNEWESCVFIDKIYWGYYIWLK